MLELLRVEFAIFQCDRGRGDALISDMLAYWLRMKRTRESWKKPGDTTELDAMIDRWSSHRGNAAYVLVADVIDDEDRCVHFNLVPGEDILIGYANAKHEELSKPLAQRVAGILGYSCNFN